MDETGAALFALVDQCRCQDHDPALLGVAMGRMVNSGTAERTGIMHLSDSRDFAASLNVYRSQIF